MQVVVSCLVAVMFLVSPRMRISSIARSGEISGDDDGRRSDHLDDRERNVHPGVPGRIEDDGTLSMLWAESVVVAVGGAGRTMTTTSELDRHAVDRDEPEPLESVESCWRSHVPSIGRMRVCRIAR